MKRIVLIHYHEINLKRNNRGWFEDRLRRHLESLLRDMPHGAMHRFAGRLFIEVPDDSPTEEIERRLRIAFGIANFAFSWRVSADLLAIRSALAQLLAGRDFRTFKIEARRGTKDFPMSSQEVNVELGAFVQELSGARVRLNSPDLTCFIEFVGKYAYVYFEKIAGGGGLPARSSGRVLCLLSGGIDSPVAAYRLMRRGCQVCYAHFHSFPHTTLESQEKVRRIVSVLSRYQMESNLFMIPFADLQREIVAYSPPSLRVLLYRRLMIRISDALAYKEGAQALVTGDSLGQVASQTLENLRSVSHVATLPIFRPLIGDDKEDIIKIARAIGTYDISILPDQDCCTMFVPRHPETMACIARLDQAEEALDATRLVKDALAASSRETIPGYLEGNSDDLTVQKHLIVSDH